MPLSIHSPIVISESRLWGISELQALRRVLSRELLLERFRQSRMRGN